MLFSHIIVFPIPIYITILGNISNIQPTVEESETQSNIKCNYNTEYYNVHV